MSNSMLKMMMTLKQGSVKAEHVEPEQETVVLRTAPESVATTQPSMADMIKNCLTKKEKFDLKP